MLSNAYKHSPSGGKVTIELPVTDVATGMRAVVMHGQGIGMTPEQLARVGERNCKAFDDSSPAVAARCPEAEALRRAAQRDHVARIQGRVKSARSLAAVRKPLPLP